MFRLIGKKSQERSTHQNASNVQFILDLNTEYRSCTHAELALGCVWSCITNAEGLLFDITGNEMYLIRDNAELLLWESGFE